jgi:hypothetical protein
MSRTNSPPIAIAALIIQMIDIISISIKANEIFPGIVEKIDVTNENNPNILTASIKKSLFVMCFECLLAMRYL